MLLCAALAMLSPTAQAERADRDKPINIEADAMQYDDLKQVNVFTGNVTLTKGTILIRGDRLVLRQDPEGYQYATAEGRPASFRQKRDGGVDQFISGVAQRLTYDGRTEKVRLEDQANLKRLERERVTDEIHGKVIIYDSRNEFFNVEGGGTSSASPENPTGRVRVVIQPRDAKPEPPAPGTLTPARSLGTPAK
jgi:lipopolysaccharide export system protein LptA